MPPKTDPGEAGASGSDQPTQVKVVVQNFSDKKIKKKFDGTSSIVQWKLCVDHVLERIKDDDMKLWTLMDALEGNALFEIQRHQLKDRDSTVKVLKLLDSKYADRRTATQIRRQFYSTVQVPGQSVLEFGDAVADSLQGTMEKLSLDASTVDAMMRDQFSENVGDTMLRWELRKEAQKTDCSFDEVRELALEWESGQTVTKNRGGAKQPSACYVTESQSQSQNDELAALRQMIVSQQEQINALTRSQTEFMEALKSKDSVGPRRRESRTCFYCGKPGHLAFECRKKKQDQERRNGDNGQYDRSEGNGPPLYKPQQGER